MDWIERLTGLDPDFGSGSLELLIAGAIVVLVAALIVQRSAKQGRKAER